MNDLEQYIQSYFGVVEQNDLTTIGELFQKETIKKGDFFLRSGGPCNRLSFIRSGMLRIFSLTEDKEVTQWISTQGYFVTDLSAFTFDQPARWSIQALTDVELYSIHREEYKGIGQLVPSWYQLENLFLARCFTILEDRIFNHLSMTAEERYLAFFESNKALFNEVPLQFIASMLGMTPETFSRIRKKQLS